MKKKERHYSSFILIMCSFVHYIHLMFFLWTTDYSTGGRHMFYNQVPITPDRQFPPAAESLWPASGSRESPKLLWRWAWNDWGHECGCGWPSLCFTAVHWSLWWWYITKNHQRKVCAVAVFLLGFFSWLVGLGFFFSNCWSCFPWLLL